MLRAVVILGTVGSHEQEPDTPFGLVDSAPGAGEKRSAERVGAPARPSTDPAGSAVSAV